MPIVFGDEKAQEIVKRDKQEFPERRLDNGMVQCPKCNGKGFFMDNCFNCGQEMEVACDTCDGIGEITKEKAEKLGQEKLARDARERERMRLRAWNSGEPIRA